MSEITTDQLASSYDYVVCGGGTSGSVVAARLAEDAGIRVLVIESGRHSKDMENVHMTGGWSNNFDGPDDWNFITEPNAAANNRQVKASRGRFLGGCSGCNGTLCVRGTKQDFDDWNMAEWTGDEVWRCMSKAETFHGKDWFKADLKNHGTTGLLHTEPMDLAPISNLMLDSMQDQGLPLQHDMFTTGDNPYGCGHAPRTVVLTQENGGQRATAVISIDKDGKPVTVKASKEIIVSGGTYCTPAILNRSGIGAREELEPLGIKTLVNLPGVGKNLMDHLVNNAGLTTDHLLYHDDNLKESYRQWKEERRGALSNFPFGAFAYARLDERMKDSPEWTGAPKVAGRDPMGLTNKQPNVEYFTTECYGGPKQYADFPIDKKHCFSIICELFSPRSRGTVKLKSTNPADNPIIDHQYLSDPLDLAVLSEACAYGNEIVTKGRGTKSILKGAWPADLTHHTYTHRDEWKPYVKDHATTCYHPGGTAKMGKDDDPLAVLDERLRVRGVKGLRVVDVSVMPTLNQGHTQMPAYAIGERAAELIRQDAGASNGVKSNGVH
ncbi:Hypothetical protein R9X50_00591800 [Acrodontium crateriforme]|uniref:Glucose-methanol-choline oxidoreductase N-terminal domain-containing protein n=1 Tax=Acrodontium crateriforme TaxID=150365 RepID=A0AAQ3R9H9_9PEZI|nr:Hypothetical protein R9X50_00591800 [Acrodontium crateriforme]